MPQESSENFFTDLLKFVVVAALIVFPVRFFVAQPFIVSGASMGPTFADGEYLIIDELSYRLSPPERGDVVIFKPPQAPREFYIKRIIGLPGETVTVQNGMVSITTANGEKVELAEPYISAPSGSPNNTYQVTEGNYFVMGDNRPESSDSRVWGLLPRQNIVGRAFLRLLPITEAAVFPGSTSYSN